MDEAPLELQALKDIVLFSAFTEDELKRLIDAAQHRRYRKGARIACAGERLDGIYVLLSGRAKVLMEDGEGREVILRFVGPGEFFGEASVLDEQRWSATAEALEPCHVAFVHRRHFLECFSNNFDAAMIVLRSAVQRLREAERKVEELALLDVYERVTRVLVDRSREVDGRWIVEPGAEQIAQMVAASREMVSRVLKDLSSKGLICRRKRSIVVLDRRSIAQRARPHLPSRERADNAAS